jgi:hypothetical protein
LINRQKQHVHSPGKHDKPVGQHSSSRGSAQQQLPAASATACSKGDSGLHVPPAPGLMPARQKSSSRRQPGKAAANIRCGASAAAAPGSEPHQAVLAELATAAEQGAGAARSSRQELLAKLLEEWSQADQVRR